MAGNVTGLHVFAGDVGPEALSLLDINYTALTQALNFLNNFTNYYVDSGVADALVVTTTVPQTVGLLAGLTLQIKVAATNATNAPTLNLNAGGAIAIGDVNGFALIPGQLQAGISNTFIYNGTKWCCQNFNNFAVGIKTQLSASKPASTGRNSVIVPANDPDLVIAIPFAGRWAFELLVAYVNTGASVTADGNVNFSGTISTGSYINTILGMTGSGLNASVTPPVVAAAVTTAVPGFQFNTVTTNSLTTPFTLFAKGVLVAGTAGNLAFAWSQHVSNASALNVIAGGYLVATLM